MTTPLTTIELTELEAAAFVEFQRHRDILMKLVESGGLDTMNGEVTMHFDHRGALREITKRAILYKI